MFDLAYMVVFMWDQHFICGFVYQVVFFHNKIFELLYQRFEIRFEKKKIFLIINHFWIKKGLLEQVSYTPAAMTSFYFLMSLLERKSVEESIEEVKNKFWPTYKVDLVLQK